MLRENGLNYRHETFRLDGQIMLTDFAPKFTSLGPKVPSSTDE